MKAITGIIEISIYNILYNGDKMLKDRIEILRSASVINDTVAQYVNKVIDTLEEYHFDEPKMEMFTTHLAMAVQRIMTSGAVEQLDESIWNEVQTFDTFNEAKQVYANIVSEAPVQIPESEEKFLLMHLCNLLQKEN
jgi:PRD domain protein